MYKVAGTNHSHTEAPAIGAYVILFSAIMLSVVLSSFAWSVTRLFNGYTATPGLSWRTALGQVPNFYPWTALSKLPATPDASGGISGKISYEGTLPKYRPLDMVNEPSCAKHYTTPVLPENVVAGTDNGLRNVVVYISEGVSEDSTATQAAVLKQWGCRYIPHVLAVQTNQEIWVQNEDSVAHTVHPLARINKEVNRSQPPGTPPLVIKYDKPEIIRVKCELHPWMRGIFVVLKNSYYAVSDEGGSFSLPDLPPGKYTVKVWHEQLGEQSQVVSIGSGETKKLNFVFKATP